MKLSRSILLGTLLTLAGAVHPAFAGILNCSIPPTILNDFADAALGTNAATCGNVTVPAGVALIDATTGAQLAATLNPFVGVVNLISQGGQTAIDGSALRFNFSASAGSIVNFKYSSTFDPGVSAFTFAVLDGAITTLAEQNFSLASLGPASLVSSSLNITTSGAHTLSFGAAVACGVVVFGLSVEACLLTTLDPSLSIQNLNVTPSGSVPEPATYWLPVTGIALFTLQRRRARV